MGTFEDLAFQSGGLPEGRLKLVGVVGHEEISRLFEFELYLTCYEAALTPGELDAVVKAPCAFAFGPDPGDVVHGVVRRLRVVDTSGTILPRYLVTVVPTAWLLTLGRTNRIFQNLTVPSLFQEVVGGYSLGNVRMAAGAGYPTHEYIVQYEESDWTFLERWLEHSGLFYWFEHGENGDVVAVGDAVSQTVTIAEPSELSYRKRNDLGTGGEHTIWQWALEQRRTPARVALIDYNYRTPATRQIGKASIDEANGFGSLIAYGDHFKDGGEGRRLARVRAEAEACQRLTFTGWSDCTRLRVGQRFTLTDHDSYGGEEYLITAIEHRAGFPIPRIDEDLTSYEKSRADPQLYLARFHAISTDIPYRALRRTPWPRITGVMQGHVEEDSSGEYAQIDKEGRYKVRLPFDSDNVGGTNCSRWIRMSQNYSGVNYGAHFPLHKGAEVLIAYVDGNPDRPVIVGTVPHALTPSPVQLANHTQSVIHTPSGLRVELEDLQE